MKTLYFTYDVYAFDESGRRVRGETCMEITMADWRGDDILNNGKEAASYRRAEGIIASSEDLKDRVYIQDSIKHITEN